MIHAHGDKRYLGVALGILLILGIIVAATLSRAYGQSQDVKLRSVTAKWIDADSSKVFKAVLRDSTSGKNPAKVSRVINPWGEVYVDTYYPNSAGMTPTPAIDGLYTTGQILEYVSSKQLLGLYGFQWARDTTGSLVFGKRAGLSNAAYFGGQGFEFRLIPDRSYGAIYIGNKIDANGNLTFDGGWSGATTTSPHGLVNVIRRGVKDETGTKWYQNSDNLWTAKFEHWMENASSTVYAGAVSAYSFLEGSNYAAEMTGVDGAVWLTTSGTVPRARAFTAMVYQNGAGTIDTAIGFHAQIAKPLGTISNAIGLNIYPLTGTKKWGIYQWGTADTNRFWGPSWMSKIIFPDGTTMTTAGGTGGADGQNADSAMGKKINSVPYQDKTVLGYYSTGDSLGWIPTVPVGTQSGYPIRDSSGTLVPSVVWTTPVGLDSSVMTTSYKVRVMRTTAAITITAISYSMRNGSSPWMRFKLAYGTDMSGSGTLVDTTSLVTNTTENLQTGASINTANVSAGQQIWFVVDNVGVKPEIADVTLQWKYQ